MKSALLLLIAYVGIAGAQLSSLPGLVQRMDQHRIDVVKLNPGSRSAQLSDSMASFVAEFNTLIRLLQENASGSDVLGSIQSLKSRIDGVTNAISNSAPIVTRLAGPVFKAFNSTMAEAMNALGSHVSGMPEISSSSEMSELNAAVQRLNDIMVKRVGSGLGIAHFG